jgi:hypothetical protein
LRDNVLAPHPAPAPRGPTPRSPSHQVLTTRLQLLNKDFYHLSASTFELKSNTPNNVAFKVTGKTSHEKATAGAVSHPLSVCPPTELR